MSTVVNLKANSSKTSPKKVNKSVETRKANNNNRLRWQMRLGIFIALMGTMLLFLSVSHLATGIQTFTQGAFWEAAVFSIIVDVGFIGLEMTQIINMEEKIKIQVDKYAKPTICGFIIFSALINAYVFSINSTGYIIYVSIILGFAIPFLTYSLFRVASILIITSNK